MKAAGFVIEVFDRKTFGLEGRKFYDQTRSKDYDRVIVWLARSVATPDDIEVYLLYGRYNEIFAVERARSAF